MSESRTDAVDGRLKYFVWLIGVAILAALTAVLIKQRWNLAQPMPKAGATDFSVHQIALPVRPNWQEAKRTADSVFYKGDPGDIHSVRLIRTAPTLPSLNDTKAVRDYFRKAAQAERGGILSVEVQEVAGHDAVVYYSKEVRDNIRGFRYVARCIIPLDQCWFEIRTDAIEMTVAIGSREAAARLSLPANAEYEDSPPDAAPTPGPNRPEAKRSKRIKGWQSDPYKSEFDSSAIRSLADDKKYDAAFPNHPLSRLRRAFPEILSKLQFNDLSPANR